MEYLPVPAHGGEPQFLLDLRHVYHRPKAEDRTAGQVACRRLAEDDFGKFLDRLARAEREWAGPRGGKEGSEPEDGRVMDEGSERGLALVRQLLTERPWEREE